MGTHMARYSRNGLNRRPAAAVNASGNGGGQLAEGGWMTWSRSRPPIRARWQVTGCGAVSASGNTLTLFVPDGGSEVLKRSTPPSSSGS
jgi:hypothetical protein